MATHNQFQPILNPYVNSWENTRQSDVDVTLKAKHTAILFGDDCFKL